MSGGYPDDLLDKLRAERNAAMAMVRVYIKDNFHSLVLRGNDGGVRMHPALPFALQKVVDFHPPFVELALIPELEAEHRRRLREAVSQETDRLKRLSEKRAADIADLETRQLAPNTRKRRRTAIDASFEREQRQIKARVVEETEKLARVPLIAKAEGK
jgi:hypothetical protein